LAHHDARWIGRVGQIIAGSGDDSHASLDKHQGAEFLRNQIAREPTSILDQHDTKAVVSVCTVYLKEHYRQVLVNERPPRGMLIGHWGR
jgi:hypothetical protein